ncbi:hypothetical protein C9374_005615 [Naegleria lovaniensis]|uniref:Uncharacterized protein n=1 Tax=Naegleria lovaniensis TaxID=51637 RepID=A0AA88KJZ9_NAELO|nr:uncharacterized protein C9374_005615 [Naegleria lovaniensis]KAG2382413.1 hypothetical protein C9374_005615 [Naegleria lovaniensis]
MSNSRTTPMATPPSSLQRSSQEVHHLQGRFFEFVPKEIFKDLILEFIPFIYRVPLIQVCKDFYISIKHKQAESIWKRIRDGNELEMNDIFDLEDCDFKLYKFDRLMFVQSERKDNVLNRYSWFLKIIYLLDVNAEPFMGEDEESMQSLSPWRKLGACEKITRLHISVPFFRMNVSDTLLYRVRADLEQLLYNISRRVEFSLNFELIFCTWITKKNLFSSTSSISDDMNGMSANIRVTNMMRITSNHVYDYQFKENPSRFTLLSNNSYVELPTRKDVEDLDAITRYTTTISISLKMKPSMVPINHFLTHLMLSKKGDIEWHWVKRLCENYLILVNGPIDVNNNTIVSMMLEKIQEKANSTFMKAKTGHSFVHNYLEFYNDTQTIREHLEKLFNLVKNSKRRTEEIYLILNQPHWSLGNSVSGNSNHYNTTHYTTTSSMISQLDSITNTKFKFFNLHLKAMYSKLV